MKKFSYPCLSFFSSCPLSLLLSSSTQLSSRVSFHQLVAISCDLHLRIIQTLCLHLSCSTPLCKTLTVDHYLPIEYFQTKLSKGVSFRDLDSGCKNEKFWICIQNKYPNAKFKTQGRHKKLSLPPHLIYHSNLSIQPPIYESPPSSATAIKKPAKKTHQS